MRLDRQAYPVGDLVAPEPCRNTGRNRYGSRGFSLMEGAHPENNFFLFKMYLQFLREAHLETKRRFSFVTLSSRLWGTVCTRNLVQKQVGEVVEMSQQKVVWG